MRLSYAARTLLAQVHEHIPEPVWSANEPDGFGVYRRLDFGGEAAEWLAGLLDFPLDPRLTEVVLDLGVLSLYFSPRSPLADDASEWVLPSLGS